MQFAEQAIDRMTRPFRIWNWPRRRWQYDLRFHLGRAVKLIHLKDELKFAAKILRLVEQRRLLDMEYRFHSLSQCWLILHAPAAWALLILILAHALSTWYYVGL